MQVKLELVVNRLTQGVKVSQLVTVNKQKINDKIKGVNGSYGESKGK